MISFLTSIALLVCGYIFYGRYVERVFKPDDRMTAAYKKEDGVDYIPIRT